MKAMIGVTVLCVLALSLALACDRDNNKSGEPSGAVSPEATVPPEATEEEGDIPEFTGGTASATLNVEGHTLTFNGGDCAVSDNEWLAVYIDEVVGEKFFGVSAGNDPSLEDPRSAQGGGEFGEGDFFVWWAIEGSSTFLHKGVLSLASDLASGEFEGTDEAGEQVTGSFACD